jgi:osmotically inducible lipoprotein OsmB
MDNVEDNRMRTIKMLSILPVLAIGFGLSACGHSEGDRAITGGALGAGAGALGGAMVGHPVAGALVGGAAGAATGALTDSDDINFGKPIWKWD